jgi:hypothetical protein
MIRPYVESFEYVEHGRSVRLFGDVELPRSAHRCLYSHIPGGALVIPRRRRRSLGLIFWLTILLWLVVAMVLMRWF